MANPHLGEVPLKVDGETYMISLSLNAMCELEEAFGKPLLEVIGDLEAAQNDPKKLKVTTIRRRLVEHIAGRQYQRRLLLFKEEVRSVEQVAYHDAVPLAPSDDIRHGHVRREPHGILYVAVLQRRARGE